MSTDVEAKSFCQSLGWRFDIDLAVSDGVRTVQFMAEVMDVVVPA
jgi:hypothetical protein